jgi:hypothetical protein
VPESAASSAGSHRTEQGSLPRICFVHIPKTAGLSIRKFFLSLYGDQAFEGLTTEDYKLVSDSTLARFNFFAGHTYHRDWTRLPAGTIFFTVLRHPVARAVSLYRYWNTIDFAHLESSPVENASTLEAIRRARMRTIYEFVASDNSWIVEHLRGAYISQFVPEEMIENGRLGGPAAVVAVYEAVDRLSKFTAVLTTERLKETFPRALSRFGLSGCNTTLSRENVSTTEVSYDQDQLYESMMQISPSDFECYSVAQKLEANLL